VRSRAEETLGLILAKKPRLIKRYVWEVKVGEEKAAIANSVIQELNITSDVARLGAMMLNGYLAKSKGVYVECAKCWKRIHAKSECVCESAKEILNLLRNETFLKDLHSLTDIAQNPGADIYKKV